MQPGPAQPADEQVKPNKKNLFWRFLAIIFGVVLLALLWDKLGAWAFRAHWDNFIKQEEKAIQKSYEIAMADTYGGKTPEETLNLYIAALEKGDYELASKYLIHDNQAKELNNLIKLKEKNNTDWFISVIKKASVDESLSDDSSKTYISRIEGAAAYYIRFRIYPNGLWKIIEI